MDEICVDLEEALQGLSRAAALRAAISEGRAPDQGLCSAVVQIGPVSVRRWLFEDWPEYSGNWLYPVPAPEGFETDPEADELGIDAAEQAFDVALANGELYVGEYGAARLRLLDHIEAKLRALV